MSDPYLGTVMPVAFQFAPQDWQICQGQNLPVNQYSALYSLLGVAFGGSQNQNFNLPDLQGRTIVGQGILNLGTPTQYLTGTKGGAVSATLTTANVPLAPHTHPVTVNVTAGGGYTPPSLKVSSTAATVGPSSGVVLGTPTDDAIGGTPFIYAPASAAGSATIPLGGFSAGTAPNPSVAVSVNANPGSIATAFSIREPYLVMHYIIAINGIYPTRP